MTSRTRCGSWSGPNGRSPFCVERATRGSSCPRTGDTPLEPGALVNLPRVWLGPNAKLGAGAYLLPDEGGAAVEALARLPMGFPGRVAAARGTPDDLVLVLGTKTELRLGEAAELRLKLDVAATVLRDLSQNERRSLEYLDVSLPTRAVALPRSQVEA